MRPDRGSPIVATPRRAAVLALVLLFGAPAVHADPRPRPPLDAAGIRLALERLQVTGSALYVTAHPDDENTAMLAWLLGEQKVRTACLSFTRGDGGQNLLGTETGTGLGVIRTQELISARRIDGAEQFFSRALDFGFSKNADETLRLWDRERILADAVWVIRRYQPDVIITRFPPDSTAGHGHHTASAILAEDAFAAAADPKRFTEQLKLVKPWQAKRLVWNQFRPSADSTAPRLTVDVGSFNPLLGRSYSEIAGESRSMHKSQGFGAAERRGTLPNTLTHRLGEPARANLFDGVAMGWNRFPGGARVDAALKKAHQGFDPARPSEILPHLIEAHRALATLPDQAIVVHRRAELLDVIRACAGLWLEAVATTPSAAPGRRMTIVTSALNRSPATVTLEAVEVVGVVTREPASRPLAFNVPVTDTFRTAVPADRPFTQPFWLEAELRRGSFGFEELPLIGPAENPPALTARLTVIVAGERLSLEVPVVHRWIDRVQGERYRDFAVVPPVTLRFAEGVHLFTNGKARPVRVVVESGDAPVDGVARLRLPPGWNSQPTAIPIHIGQADAETTVHFMVTAAATPRAAEIVAECEIGGRRFDRQRTRIDYPHIPIQTLFPRAAARVIRTDLTLAVRRVGYIPGSGDEIPAALTQMGAEVVTLSEDDLEGMDLGGLDAIVVGVRAYNTRPRLRALQSRLLGYVERGGRLLIQYNTNESALDDRLGPYPFKISRERVTVEEAPVTLLLPEHPLLQHPNRISAQDFEGWVQERGLYFASPSDPRYEKILACNDPNEPAREGGLLYARHGQGAFIYTGYAWFRQLPAGVPGAWRLFANLLSAPVGRP